MATYTFESLLNKADGMTKVNEYVVQEKTLEIEGASWYHYAGNAVNKLYINGKGYIGFGADVEHLKMFWAKAANNINDVYRQEGVLDTGAKFLKLKLKGIYNHYYDKYAYEYEVFLFDDGNIFVYIIKSAKNEYNTLFGDCEVTNGKTTDIVLAEYHSDFKKYPISRLISNAGIKPKVIRSKYTPIKEAGVRIKTNPAAVYVPNALDWSELSVESYDSSGNTNAVSNFTFPDVDVSTVGTKTVKLSYKTYSVPVEITVKEDTVLELTKFNLRDHYLLNETLEIYSVTAVWDSGKNETLTSGFDVSGFDSATPGTKELTISYKGAATTKSIYVAATATLTIDGAKTEYYIGDDFESANGIITYDDGEEESVYELIYSGFDNTIAGEQVITATVRGVSTTYTVHVSDTVTANIGANVETDAIASLNLITGLLTVSGTGDTKDIDTPSYFGGGIFDGKGDHSSQVKKIVVQEGITGLIGACFYGMSNVTEVSLPSTLKTIGQSCFSGCSLITTLLLPEGLETLQDGCFYNCSGLTELTLPSSLKEITGTIIDNKNAVLTILSRTVLIGEYSIYVKTIRGYIGSTAETYANSNNIPFEAINNILKIEIVNYPSKTYHVGETISKADLTVQMTLEDGTVQETDLYELSYDFSSTGTKTVTVFIGDKSDTFNVDVTTYKLSEVVNTLTGMQLIENSGRDEGTDILDGVSWFRFNNVITDKLYVNGNNWIGFGVSSEQLKICNRDGATHNIYRMETELDGGIKLLKIRVEGYTYFAASEAHESQIKYELFLFDNGDMYLNVIQSPIDTSIYAGISSLTSNGKTTNLSLNGATPESPVQVSFIHQDESGLDWNISYRPYSLATLVGIKVAQLPDKTRYMINETFKSSGLIVNVVYDDGSSGVIKKYTLSSPDMTSYGSKSITVTFESFTTTFDIMVVDVAKIEVTSLPTKTRYYEDDEFLSSGIIVSQVYTDGIKEEIAGYSLSSPDMSSGGEKTITVTYNKFTTTFTIMVIGVSGIEVSKTPIKTEYYTNDSLDASGLEVISKYTDGTSRKLTDYSVSKLDSSSAGEKEISVTHKNYTATFKVTVYELKGIRISHYPNKIYYKIGETFDPSGLTVVEVRNDGSEKEITDYTISGFDSSKAGSKTITVFYNMTSDGITRFVGSDSFQIKVTNDGKNPFDSNIGETEENTEPVYVTVHWIDGEFEDLTHENGGIKANTFVLQESICSEQYFIFGGCISNQVSFETGHKQFWGTDEDSYPSGRIEVYLECNKTQIKVFTGRIASAERTSIYSTRKIVAYDYLYDLRNTDIARWYKSQIADKKKKLTQKQFRDMLFKFLGIEQISTKLHWDDAYVPYTNNANEINAVNVIKDLCLQNDRFGWMNRDGKFEYLKLRQNSQETGETISGKKIYKYYDNAEVHLDTFKSFWAKEGRIWFPHTIYTDPDPNRAFGFTAGEPTAQEAYENNVFYNRNSFFVGNEDWMDYVWNADEYGGISREKPIINICYGTFVNLDLRKFYRAQAYTVEVIGNPLNTVGQTIELRNTKQMEDGTELEWYVHSYIMSRTLKLGNSQLIDSYSANNAPFNSNSRQLGKDTPEISATVNRTRSEMPVVSYGFSDGTSDFTPAAVSTSGGATKKTALRCMKRIKKDDYDKLPAAARTRGDTIFMTYKES
nr:MAG TPA: leucine-rich repeat protein [Caudoviricetes sp.]